MHKRQKQHFILGAAVLALVACASTGPDAVKSDDPTTQAISEKYVETPEDVAVPTSGSAGFSGGGGDDEVVVTGARIRGSKERSAPPAAPVMMMPEPSADYMTADGTMRMSAPPAVGSGVTPPDSPFQPQAGLLTAGDYDDVLNPDLYKTYVDKMLQGQLSGKDLPYVDADQRINIRVVDRLGKAVPMADISLKYADGEKMFPLRTGADGMAYLYPNYDVLKPGIVVSVSAQGSAPVETILTAEMIDGGGEIVVDLETDRKLVDKLDLLLTIDATGSMSDEMRYLQKELQSIVSRVEAAHPGVDIRTGLIVYRDRGDAYVVRETPFTDDIEVFQKSLAAQRADGGGDMPEAMHTAMRTGLKMDWRDEALKINLLVADAPPHDEDISDTWKAGLISRTRGIHIVPLAASGVDKTAEFLMRGMAQITGGRFMFLTDDSGIGNPHAEPTVDCYVVTRLDNMVTRILNSLISGQRDEPEADEVIRSVGNYRSGVCAPVGDDPKTSLQNVSSTE